MKIILNQFLRLIALILLLSCGSTKSSTNSSWSNNCPLERLDWMKVSENYNSKKVADLSAALSAAAAADASVIKGLEELNAESDFSFELDKVIENESKNNIEVSQEFYENYINQRVSLCALLHALQANPPIYTSESARAKAEEAFTTVSQNFHVSPKKEEKKTLPQN